MAPTRTLLVGDPGWSWRDRPSEGPLLCLDPARADVGPPARATVSQDDKVIAWRFVGTLDAARNPIDVLAATVNLLEACPGVTTVQTFELRENPTARQLALAVASVVRPGRILVPQGSAWVGLPWPVGPEEVERPAQVPTVVLEAQRRARWLELLEHSDRHQIDLERVPTIGARLGSGREVKELGYAGRSEVFGSTLLLVGEEEPEPATAGRYLDIAHAAKLVNVAPKAFEGLVCCLERESGEPLGLGVVAAYDPVAHVLEVQSPAVVPAPVRQVRFGGFRVDSNGREGPALPSWSL